MSTPLRYGTLPSKNEEMVFLFSCAHWLPSANDLFAKYSMIPLPPLYSRPFSVDHPQDMAELLCQRYPLAGVNIAFVDAPMMLHALEARVSAGDAHSKLQDFTCQKIDARMRLENWMAGGQNAKQLVLPVEQVARTPGALVAQAGLSTTAGEQLDEWEAWLSAQLRLAAEREREACSRDQDAALQKVEQAHREETWRWGQAPLDQARTLATHSLEDSQPIHRSTTGAFTSGLSEGRTMHAGLIEQRSASESALSSANMGEGDWIDRQIAMAVRREQEQAVRFSRAQSARLADAGFIRLASDDGRPMLVVRPPPPPPRRGVRMGDRAALSPGPGVDAGQTDH